MARTKKKAEKEKPVEDIHPIEHFVRKLGRFCAWAIIVLMFIYFISGWGMTKSSMIYNLTGGLLDRGASARLHNYLILPMAFAFLCHTLVAIRFAMIRWNIQTEKNEKTLNYVFLGVGVVLFALACWAYFL
ncbi:hypothetical protein KY359_00275 [Candidatus Woesearchaeota archaeon]|nr:hypothetical protein [Candidatus Woesearchaeota archaeon]